MTRSAACLTVGRTVLFLLCEASVSVMWLNLSASRSTRIRSVEV